MRLPRNIKTEHAADYHLSARTLGQPGDRPLCDPEAAAELQRICKFYLRAYRCQAAALEILDDQLHLPVRFEAFRLLNQPELKVLAPLFYPGRYRPWKRWDDVAWARFNRRIFHPSELMRNILQAFTTWYNGKYRRRGPLWADRHANTVTDNLRETVLYLELHPVRAGLVRCPEDWVWGSARLRKNGTDGWLMPIETLMDTPTRDQARRAFWDALAWRGGPPGQDGDLPGVPSTIKPGTEPVYVPIERGRYLSRIPAITCGRALGSRQLVMRRLAEDHRQGTLKHRREPIPLGFADLYCLIAPVSRRTRPDLDGGGGRLAPPSSGWEVAPVNTAGQP